MRPEDPHEEAPRLAPFAKDGSTEALLAAVNEALADATLPLPAASGLADRLGLVYVVGTPRSGTTLVHQLLARFLAVGYVDNVTAAFWRRPSVGLALSASLLTGEERRVELSSLHGVAPGAAGPHEFGYFWRHWLRLDETRTHHLDAAELERVDADGLRRTLRSELLAAAGRPFVLKNLICGLQAGFLSSLHPSLFVDVRRDTEAVARSVLATRQARYGDPGVWWSLKPAAWPLPAGDPVDEVIGQLRAIRHELDEELSRPGVARLAVSYEEVCADPTSFLEQVRRKLERLTGTAPARTGDPPPLEASVGPRLPDELEARLAVARRTRLLA